MQYEATLTERVGTDTIHPEFVPVLFAAEMKQARRVKDLLESNNIPALLDHDLDGEVAYTVLPRGIGVLVPDQMHTVASEIVASDEGEDDIVIEMDDDDDDFDSDMEDDDDLPEEDDLDDDDDLDDLDDLDDDYDTDVMSDDDDDDLD